MPNDLSSQEAVWALDETLSPDKYPNGIFKVTYAPPSNTPTDAVQRLKTVTSKINTMAMTLGRAADPKKKYANFTNKLRKEQLLKLKNLARKLRDGQLEDQGALEELGYLGGTYAVMSNEIAQHEAATVSPDDDPENADAGIWSLTLNPLQWGATPEQTALSIEIQRAYDVVDIVMDRRQDKASTRPGWLTKTAIRKSQIVRKNYVHQLKEIAEEGLRSPELTGYAARKLDLFKEAFVQREADRVKNQHVKALGTCVILFAIVFTALATVLEVVVRHHGAISLATVRDDTPTTLAMLAGDIQNFLFLAIGASVGTWMSFTLRKVELGFEELILLEPDRLNPSARIVFVVILTMVVGGILQLGWLTIGFADGKDLTPAAGLGPALLLGILCGIAERSLSGAVVGRADSISNAIRPMKPAKGDN